MAGTIVVDRIESDASYASTINVAGQITFSNTVNFGVFAGTAPVAGFYLPTTNNLAFTTASTERMRIDSSGNVGIGTTTPGTTPGAGQLVVAGADIAFATNDNANMVVRTTDLTATNKGGMIGLGGVSESGNLTFATIKGAKESTDAGYLAFATRTASAYATERMRITSAGYVGIATQTSSLAMLEVRANSATIPQLFLQQDNTVHGWIQYADRSDGGIKFYRRDNSGSTERMRIDTNGAMMLGSSIAGTFGLGGYFFVKNASGPIGSFSCQNSATALGFGNQSGTATYNAIYFYTNAYGTNVGGIAVNSGSTSYNTTSDYRLKESILPMTGALARVSALKPVTYKWKPDDSDGEGFIAHELAEVCPHAVTGEKDAVDEKGDPKYQQVDVSFLVATLTAAIQEQQALITSLTARITALESK